MGEPTYTRCPKSKSVVPHQRTPHKSAHEEPDYDCPEESLAEAATCSLLYYDDVTGELVYDDMIIRNISYTLRSLGLVVVIVVRSSVGRRSSVEERLLLLGGCFWRHLLDDRGMSLRSAFYVVPKITIRPEPPDIWSVGLRIGGLRRTTQFSGVLFYPI